MENGKIIKEMEKVLWYMLMDKFTRESGKITWNLDMVSYNRKIQRMEVILDFLKGIFRMEWQMDMESIIPVMDGLLNVNGKIGDSMDKDR